MLGLGSCVGSLLAGHGAAAQQLADKNRELPVENVWLLYSTDARLSEKWGVHADAQIRRSRTVAVLRHNQARVGINYHATSQVTLTAGYSYVAQFSTDDSPAAIHAPEHRLYEQLVLQDVKGLVRMQHRYRLEQRRLVRPGEDRAVYLNRLRYQLRGVLPLRGAVLQPGTPYVAASDELLFDFGRNATGSMFSQNRAYLALGYQFTKATALEAGYLHQLFIDGVAPQRHVAQLSLTFNPDLRPLPEAAGR
ncbi:DUF2490 domain-containing protein [Hymenobacter algoricola]|uniref:DUF2490 domain-containing protein n=1 Tax=Hymenobacter algoricola TaxID=486267 RepID=A0ABP7MFK2_9BACT